MKTGPKSIRAMLAVRWRQPFFAPGAATPARAADPTAAPAPGGPVAVTAKLVEIPSKFPPDDLYDYAYVMRYEVQGGPLDKQNIFVAHYKPRQPRGKIKDGMKAHVARQAAQLQQRRRAQAEAGSRT